MTRWSRDWFIITLTRSTGAGDLKIFRFIRKATNQRFFDHFIEDLRIRKKPRGIGACTGNPSPIGLGAKC
uniref:Uncharacterized protein n=1 Tax=Candidatus Kentrum sp. UNK TaxID=2126344 RepID=A0A451A2T3_9GAMM|nr:MAG: hypothetical protein BECKUNK1418G_GA0071005_101113 [Candidatus Kentron sp. UNK]VFK69218.1 MAG: hypothetical protein BECKUNK1418H_GA0071006_101213 [Candidatus Kentron sp. UNK]